MIIVIASRNLISGGLWSDKESAAAQTLYSWEDSARSPHFDAHAFKTGDHVHHAQFGSGVVVSTKSANGDVEMVVAFNGSIKKLLGSYARLQKID